MKSFFKQTSLRTLVSLVSILCSLAACFLLYFFAKQVDDNYSDLIERDVKARTIVQSVFEKRISNVENFIRIETTNNVDTIDKYLDRWYNKALETGNTFDSLQNFIPADSSDLISGLKDVIEKRTNVINHTARVLKFKRTNININPLDSVIGDAKVYYNSLSSFLETYNRCLLNASSELTKRTTKKSALYLSILPIPLIIMGLIFIYTLIVVFKDFSKDE